MGSRKIVRILNPAWSSGHRFGRARAGRQKPRAKNRTPPVRAGFDQAGSLFPRSATMVSPAARAKPGPNGGARLSRARYAAYGARLRPRRARTDQGLVADDAQGQADSRSARKSSATRALSHARWRGRDFENLTGDVRYCRARLDGVRLCAGRSLTPRARRGAMEPAPRF